MTKEDLEKEAEIFVSEKADKGNFDVEKFGKAYFSESSMKQALVKFAEKRIAELEEEVTRLRNENLDIINKYTRFAETDRRTIAELEAQIEKMKCCRICAFYKDLAISDWSPCKTCENKSNWEFAD